MSRREQYLFLGMCATVFAAAALAALWMGLSDLPCPRGVDDAFYKSPAAELVQTGRLTQPSVVGYLPRADEAFAAYPPLYQLVVAGWFGVFGISTGASVGFGHAVHLLSMAAIMALVAAALAPQRLSIGLRALAVCAAGVVFFGILRFFDRQEELALLFCWIEMILHLRGRLTGYRGMALTGLLIGLSGMVSPWAGLIFALVVTVREFVIAPRSALPRILAVAAVAVFPVAVWLGWMEWMHPHIIREQFAAHLRVSERTTIFDAPLKAVSSLLYSPYQWPAFLLTLVLFPRMWKVGNRPAMPAGLVALFTVSVDSLVFALLTRANSYNYIWLCLFLLIPCFGYLAGQLCATPSVRERIFPVLLILLCVGVSLRDAVSLSLIAHDLPGEERADPIFARLSQRVPAGEPVATTSRYWYLFQGRNPWRITAIYPHLNEKQRREWAEWIVLPPDHGSAQEREELTRGFELVESVPSNYHTMAPSFHREDRTWAYELYRRKQEH